MASRHINADDNAQVAWPEPASPVEVRAPTVGPRDPERQGTTTSKKSIERRMNWKDFFNISIAMGGSTLAWSLELGYGTPFLRGLGLPEQLTSLVWLAGPISGLIAQPLIGAISDSSTSAYRRRFWIWLAAGSLVVVTIVLAYVEPIASFLVDMFTHMEDWNPGRRKKVSNLAIIIAVICFYILDFALNALQASLRNLLLDITPAEQLATGNAWHGRMTHAGNIIGYTLGAQDLDKWPILKPFGDGHFRKVCILTVVIISVTVSITCITSKETARDRDITSGRGRFRDTINNITKAIYELPKPIRRVCIVQLFAFMGWFPYLFYATVWVGEVMAYELDREPTVADATRAGELALLLSSIVSVVVGTVLPYIAQRDPRLLSKGDGEDEEEDEEISRIRAMVRSWKQEAARMGRPLHLPAMPFMLRNIWTGGLLLFGILMLSTFIVRTVWQATLVISLVGISWAIACWVPFAIIMEYLKEVDAAAAAPPVAPQSYATRRSTHTRVASSPAIWRGMQNPRGDDERQPLLRRQSLRLDYEAETGEVPTPMAGGTVLGIHNLAIVFPQFIIALVATAIFRIVDSSADSDPNDVYYHKNGVAWLLRFGGLCSIVAAAFSRAVAPTRTEKEMRRRLAEMKEQEAE
ncbi:SubName: Full=Related to General alpha-glucoside permease {ECO:0000313/EMBL:CCA71223.1} [Serendipita indica DSM 11827]|uniref:Related to General alpha-glucoside permease n=1 Tax=Serendipita indica (strain DSM 11827) TaxID=1109443 RepID=G4TIT0_SERID|nr:SubName: Full=Related to General alpha-glucoside permease {ECO:0000313/EMBL:CCA71223.1} [Serendipita indica DSM 11827]CCA71223.1 related to General alpha-glucoside permease [Serendipita indica DSM 11827]